MKRETAALKWLIGIFALVVYVAVGRGVILSDGAGYDTMEQEWDMSTGQSWAMVLWTVAVIYGAVKVFSMITNERDADDVKREEGHIKSNECHSIQTTSNNITTEKQEPPELGVRQKIEIAQCLYNNSCIAVAEAYEKVFVGMFPSPHGASNQLFVVCMQAAVSWLTMYSYDCRHPKARCGQIMGWLELASRSKTFPRCVDEMNSRQYRVEVGNEASFEEKMAARCETYARCVYAVMKKEAVSLDINTITEQLHKAFHFVEFWYDDKLKELIRNQKSFEPVVPGECPRGSYELEWIAQCKSDIEASRW